MLPTGCAVELLCKRRSFTELSSSCLPRSRFCAWRSSEKGLSLHLRLAAGPLSFLVAPRRIFVFSSLGHHGIVKAATLQLLTLAPSAVEHQQIPQRLLERGWGASRPFGDTSRSRWHPVWSVFVLHVCTMMVRSPSATSHDHVLEEGVPTISRELWHISPVLVLAPSALFLSRYFSNQTITYIYTRCTENHVALVRLQYFSERLAGLSCVKPLLRVHGLHCVLGDLTYIWVLAAPTHERGFFSGRWSFFGQSGFACYF